jgi:hypothetical protein
MITDTTGSVQQQEKYITDSAACHIHVFNWDGCVTCDHKDFWKELSDSPGTENLNIWKQDCVPEKPSNSQA